MFTFKLKDADFFVNTEANLGGGIILLVKENIPGKNQ